MSLADKLRLYLADKPASWTDDAATWTADGRAQLLVAVEGPLTAQTLVDAHVRALAARAKLTLAHTGAPTSVALRTAARFGITLLDAATLPDAPTPSPFSQPSPAPALAPVSAPIPAAELATPTPFDRAPAPMPAPLAEPPALLVAHSDPEPEVTHADDALPWDLSLSSPDPEPVHVEAAELLLMPWHAAADDQHELMPAGRSARHAPARPTAMAHEWGLPWPRPVAPTDGLAIADPRIWHAPERMQAVREDLDRAGAPSFGVAKPEGSAWLKRVSELG